RRSTIADDEEGVGVPVVADRRRLLRQQAGAVRRRCVRRLGQRVAGDQRVRRQVDRRSCGRVGSGGGGGEGNGGESGGGRTDRRTTELGHGTPHEVDRDNFGGGRQPHGTR